MKKLCWFIHSFIFVLFNLIRSLKSDDAKAGSGGSSGGAGGSGGSSSGAPSKLLGGKKDKKAKQAAVSDIGVIDGAGNDEKKDHTDSFEKYYNKDLDLDEGTFQH